jgi:hypothetical protein
MTGPRWRLHGDVGRQRRQRHPESDDESNGGASRQIRTNDRAHDLAPEMMPRLVNSLVLNLAGSRSIVLSVVALDRNAGQPP